MGHLLLRMHWVTPRHRMVALWFKASVGPPSHALARPMRVAQDDAHRLDLC